MKHVIQPENQLSHEELQKMQGCFRVLKQVSTLECTKQARIKSKLFEHVDKSVQHRSYWAIVMLILRKGVGMSLSLFLLASSLMVFLVAHMETSSAYYVADLNVQNGTVHVMRNNVLLAVAGQQKLLAGDTIHVPEDGKAEIYFYGSSHATLASNTKVRIDKAELQQGDQRVISLELEKGVIEGLVYENKKEEKTTFAVVTSDAVVEAPEASGFKVTVGDDGKIDTVAAARNTIEIIPTESESDALSVKEGQSIALDTPDTLPATNSGSMLAVGMNNSTGVKKETKPQTVGAHVAKDAHEKILLLEVPEVAIDIHLTELIKNTASAAEIAQIKLQRVFGFVVQRNYSDAISSAQGYLTTTSRMEQFYSSHSSLDMGAASTTSPEQLRNLLRQSKAAQVLRELEAQRSFLHPDQVYEFNRTLKRLRALVALEASIKVKMAVQERAAQ